MLNCYTTECAGAIPIQLVAQHHWQQWIVRQSQWLQSWVQSIGFIAEPDTVCLVPDQAGALATVIYGVADAGTLWSYADLVSKLPARTYHFSAELPKSQIEQATIAWGLASYRFTRFKLDDKPQPLLALDAAFSPKQVNQYVSSLYLIRDLINLPAETLGPDQFSDTIRKFASELQMQFSEIKADDLLKQNFPAIHAVGRASDQAPRLITLQWGDNSAPAVSLVGKGVCFDSGGLDIKPSSGMILMKKDMGGAAQVLGLTKLLVTQQLPICLRVYLPIVENSISGNAYRPGDVIATRQGLQVEIGNTDAEGRLILADALTYAAEQKPDLLLDFATLTGAARVALGTELPALFSNDDSFADALLQQGESLTDPLWRLPLHQAYRKQIDSAIADLSNTGTGGYGGAITAALFLQAFVANCNWVHIDLMAWNTSSEPGRPQGGEAMAVRAMFATLYQRFTGKSFNMTS